MEVAVIGLHRRFCDEQLFEEVHACMYKLGFGSSDMITLMTCNRIEIYLTGGGVFEKHPGLIEQIRSEFREDIGKRFYTFLGSDVLRHLAEVAAGLDSLILGETDIQHQVKQAYEKGMGHLSAEGHFLFQKALHMAKKVRTLFAIKPSLTLAEHVFALIKPYLLQGQKWAFMGQSELNRQIVAQCMPERLSQSYIISKHKPASDSFFAPMIHCDYSDIDQLSQLDGLVCATKNFTLEHLFFVKKGGVIVDLTRPKIVKACVDLYQYKDLHAFEVLEGAWNLHQAQTLLDAKVYIDQNVKRLMGSRQLKVTYSCR